MVGDLGRVRALLDVKKRKLCVSGPSAVTSSLHAVGRTCLEMNVEE